MTVPNTQFCAIAGSMAAGADCAQTLKPQMLSLTLDELIDMLEPQEERTCVPVTGMNICSHDQTVGVPVKLPARGGAIIQDRDDWTKQKTALEQACRELGKKCSYEVKNAISAMGTEALPSKSAQVR